MFEGDTWHGQNVRDRAVGVDPAVAVDFYLPPGRVFALPDMRFWLSPSGPYNTSVPVLNISQFGITFLEDSPVLQGIKNVRLRPPWGTVVMLAPHSSALGAAKRRMCLLPPRCRGGQRVLHSLPRPPIPWSSCAASWPVQPWSWLHVRACTIATTRPSICMHTRSRHSRLCTFARLLGFGADLLDLARIGMAACSGHSQGLSRATRSQKLALVRRARSSNLCPPRPTQ